MRIYRFLALSALSALICVSSASADCGAQITVSSDGLRAHLSGTADLASLGFEPEQIKSYSPYYPLWLSVALSDGETGERLYVNQVCTDDDGTFGLDFIMKSEEKTCHITIYSAYGKIYEGDADYTDGTVGKFNEIAKTEDVGEMGSFMQKYSGYMGVDLSLFNRFTDGEKQRVLTAAMKGAPNGSKAQVRANFSDAVFNVGLTAESLTAEDKSRMFNEYMDALGEDYAEIAQFINTHSLGAHIIALFNTGDYSSVKDEIYAISLRAYLENNVDNIYDLEVLFADDNLFSIPDSDLKRFNALTKKTAFYGAFLGEAENIVSLDDFHAAVKRCITDAEKKAEDEKDSSSPGGGGGGGKTSGGKGGSVSISGPSTPTVTPTPDKAEITYSDLDGYDWAKTAITSLSKCRVINGSDGKFLPGDSIKREEFAKICSLAFALTENGGAKSFNDVNDSDWFAKYVRILSSNGVIGGISDTEFGAGRAVTRQDAAVIIARLIKAENVTSSPFADDADIADYAKIAVYSLKDSGIISGYADGTFRPDGSITRAEAATLIHNILKLGKGGINLES